MCRSNVPDQRAGVGELLGAVVDQAPPLVGDVVRLDVLSEVLVGHVLPQLCRRVGVVAAERADNAFALLQILFCLVGVQGGVQLL